jgi:uncharacterized membrane protein YhaH (DUF805 family)
MAAGVGTKFLDLLRLAFGFSAPVSRRAYLTAGLALAGVKYLVEGMVLELSIGRAWTPVDYLVPSIQRYEALPHATGVALAIWAVPFIWVGISMTVRRALDAGLPPAVGLLFFLPVVNYLVMFALAAQPSRPRHRAESAEGRTRGRSALRSAFFGVAAAALVMAAATAFSTWVLRSYATILFVGTPFVMGFVSAWLFNADAPRTTRATLGVACVSVLSAAGALLLLAIEGAFCLAMATPIALVLALIGAALGQVMCLRRTILSPAPPIVLMLALPVLMGATQNEAAPLREQASSIEIDAPAEVVWRNVVGFGELPPPTEWVFRHGIAYPIRATIAGRGPGAVRRCEFSTGAFVEPITVWDEPRRLAFDVADEPPGMQELSPYETVRAPHVSGYLKSRRGEFRLVALAGGRTRLEGSTHYTLDVFPTWYWSRYADAIIERIHMRVLRHVKALSEAAR